jgi:phosphate transport system protein
MRETYNKQLEMLHNELTLMGAMCEESINCAIGGLIENDLQLRQKSLTLEKEIDMKKQEIEHFCLRLLLREQPVARDLRFITTSQKMISDMERIGDNAADIALLYERVKDEQRVFAGEYVEDMSKAVAKILSDAVDCFVKNQIERAKKVVLYDEVVDNYFHEIKQNLTERIATDGKNGELWLDILMTAKYLERIGDHAKNIARLVVFHSGEKQ